MTEIDINIVEWLGGGHGPREDVATRGLLRVDIRGVCFTRNESDWSRSTSQQVHVSMYPLAMWLAANWWRLCWEPRRSEAEPDYEWRASHDWGAAGGGYLWPHLRVHSDGESVTIESRSTHPSSKQPIKYLISATGTTARAEFERVVSEFVQTVIARLHREQLSGTALEQTWSEVQSERASQEHSYGRRLEAALGFDPDEATTGSVSSLVSLRSEAGAAASQELAAALAGLDVPQVVARLRSAASNGSGGNATLDAATERDIAACREHAGATQSAPWERGMAAARVLRSRRGLGVDEVTTGDLLGLVGLPAEALDTMSAIDWLPSGLAIRRDGRLRVLLRTRDRRSRRFELARLIGDLAAAPESDTWHPVTMLKTARQKAQRAFAAELLCPTDGLSRFLGADRSEDALDAAAERFDVSTRVVEHQIDNHLDW